VCQQFRRYLGKSKDHESARLSRREGLAVAWNGQPLVYQEGEGDINGWGDDLGLARLPEKIKQHMIRDISLLVKE